MLLNCLNCYGFYCCVLKLLVDLIWRFCVLIFVLFWCCRIFERVVFELLPIESKKILKYYKYTSSSSFSNKPSWHSSFTRRFFLSCFLFLQFIISLILENWYHVLIYFWEKKMVILLKIIINKQIEIRTSWSWRSTGRTSW